MLSPARFLAALAFSPLALTPAAAQAVAIENVAVGSGPIMLYIPKIEFEQPTLTQAELATLFDPAQSATLAERLGRLSARSIRLSDLTVERTIEAGPYAGKFAVSYGSFTFDDVTSGKARRMAMTGARSTVGEKNLSMVMTLLPGSALEVDLAAMARVATTTAGPGDTSRALLYRSFVWDGMAMEVPNLITAKIGRMTASDVRMRPLKQPFASFLAAMQPDPSPSAPPITGERLKTVLRFYADLADAYEAGPSEFEGLSFEFKDPRTGNDSRFDIRRASLDRFASRVMGQIVLDGIAVKQPDKTISIASFTLRPVDFAPFADTLAELGDQQPEAFMQANWRRLLPNFSGFVVRDVAMDLPNDKPDDPRVKLGFAGIDVSLAGHTLGFPTQIAATVQDLTFDLKALAASVPEFQQFIEFAGFDVLKFSNVLTMRWSEAAKTLAVSNSLQIDKLLGYTVEGLIGNAVAQLFAQDLEVARVAALGLTVHEASLRLDNRGGYERFVEKFAGKLSLTPEVFRQQLTGFFSGPLAAVGAGEGGRSLGQALEQFNQNPRNIRINAKAKKPEGIVIIEALLLAEPLDLLNKVDLSAQANQ